VYRIKSNIRISDSEFIANRDQMQKLVSELRGHLETLSPAAGSAEHIARHEKRGKLPVRDRLAKLFDPDTPFLEFSALAAHGMYDGSAPSAGVVTGAGLVHGREVVVVANDATVKGGTYFPMTIKKHLRAQEIALEHRLPCIYLVDSGGIFLPEQAGTFPDKDHFGRIFYNQARMSAEGIPQIAVVMGSCTAGGAYVPAMSDETVIVKGNGTIFIGGPPLVKAATGQDVTAEELGGADVHTRISGVADHFAVNDEQALQMTRNIVEALGRPTLHVFDRETPEDPAYDPKELYGIASVDLRKPFDIKEVIARMVDGSRFQEFKARYGTTMVCGFARIHGYLVGILGNNGVLFSESSKKGAHFIELCGMRKIPLIFLQNITGFIVGKQYEHGAIASDGAKMVHAVSCADVPKLTVVVGGSYGAGNYAMCGRGYNPRLLWMWPNARISVMGPQQAADVLVQVKREQLEAAGKQLSAKEAEAISKPVIAKYEHEGNPYYSTARLWDDGILDPIDSRQAISLAIAMAANKPVPDYRPGVYRM
jgi:acetyl-CoA carboxylase carboxyltransferase component